MAPKGGAAKAVRNVKKVVEKVDHRNRMFTHIKAGMANASPPLGTQLGQVGINVQAFVKDFNLKSSVMKQGIKSTTYLLLDILQNPPVSITRQTDNAYQSFRSANTLLCDRQCGPKLQFGHVDAFLDLFPLPSRRHFAWGDG